MNRHIILLMTMTVTIIAASVSHIAAQDADTAATDTSAVAAPSPTLKIATDPPGAAVKVGDKDYGASPVEITDIATGEHAIELSLPGHFRRRATIILDSAGADLLFELSRPATLVITGEPEGAAVVFDGKEAGAAPIIVERLRPGDYKVSAAMEGYVSVDTTVSVASGANDTLRIALEPLAPPSTQPAEERVDIAAAEGKDMPAAPTKKTWKIEAALIAFFAFLAIVAGIDKSSY